MGYECERCANKKCALCGLWVSSYVIIDKNQPDLVFCKDCWFNSKIDATIIASDNNKSEGEHYDT